MSLTWIAFERNNITLTANQETQLMYGFVLCDKMHNPAVNLLNSVPTDQQGHQMCHMRYI